MRIISSFHDYYDITMNLGYDSDIIFRRESFEERLEKYPFARIPMLHVREYRGRLSWNYMYSFVVGFCGKVFNGISTYDNEDNIYNIEQLDKFMEKLVKEKLLRNKDVDDYFKNKKIKSIVSPRKDFIKYFDTKYSENLTTKFFEKSPIFTIDSYQEFDRENNKYYYKLQYNPCLKDLDFQTVKGTAETYQEIFMDINNRAVPFKEIPKIDDKTMSEIKGFDKFSFRKEKSK